MFSLSKCPVTKQIARQKLLLFSRKWSSQTCLEVRLKQPALFLYSRSDFEPIDRVWRQCLDLDCLYSIELFTASYLRCTYAQTPHTKESLIMGVLRLPRVRAWWAMAASYPTRKSWWWPPAPHRKRQSPWKRWTLPELKRSRHRRLTNRTWEKSVYP